MSSYHTRIRMLLAGMALMAGTTLAPAQNPVDSSRSAVELHERAVKRQRQGAGVRMGSWQMLGMGTMAGATTSTLPAFEGYWQKGLDRHLALETSVGFFQRTQRSGSPSGGESVTAYVVPMMTALKVYPVTGPENSFEPFVIGGFGFTLGVDDRSATSGGLFGSSSGGTLMVPGVGIKLGGGVEYRLGRAFGFAVGSNYQYVRFFEQVANTRTYKGVQLLGGVTYRFQF